MKLRKTVKTRIFSFLLADIFFIVLSVFLAFLLRFEGVIPPEYFDNGGFWAMVIIALISVIPTFYYFNLYLFSWAYVSATELISLIGAIVISFSFAGAIFLILRDQPFFQGFPRSVIIISYFLIFVFSGGIRFVKRIYLRIFKGEMKKGSRTLIVGAEDVGEQILRSILSAKTSSYLPVGFVDNSLAKRGVSIHGLKVLGGIDDIPQIIDRYDIERMIIALPSGSKVIEKSVELGRKAGLKNIQIVPSMNEIISGDVSFTSLREVGVGDLLGRDQVELNMAVIENFIKNKKVLITGAAGSIGSELSRQVANLEPSLLLVSDQDETGIFNISNELAKRFPNVEIKDLIVDVRDNKKIEEIFGEFRPSIVFHAAAYKHVPLMEKHPDEAVKNNIFGTKVVAEAAMKNGTEKFIFVSTDKAVNPTSVMGATKRVGEMICQKLNSKGQTKFISVRFGNVLDSRGSVIPIFREKISKRQPLEVTHPEMKRYFMVIPEACLLVMQAAEMGKGGEVFVLDMGEPVKIVDLAREMIRLSGLEPDKDIPIVFSGLRPGEKLFEEILTAEEGTVATQNQSIFAAKLSAVNESKLNEGLQKLAERSNKKEIVGILRQLTPFHNPEFDKNS